MSVAPVFLKQYGDKRTGTNYLRVLLGANYENATVLMHVLGDKHSPPVDLRAVRTATLTEPEPENAFVRAATLAAPSETTRSACPRQQEYLAGLSRPLAAAHDEGRLVFLLSVRHPRSWAASLAHYYGHMFRKGSRRYGLELASFLQEACREYNRKYEAWWRYHGEFQGRSVVVRHEDLLRNSRQTVEAWAKNFGLVRRAGEWNPVRERIDAAEWDQHESSRLPDFFEIEFYRAGLDRDPIGPQLWRVIEQTIDWKLAAHFGYEPRPSTWYRRIIPIVHRRRRFKKPAWYN